MCSKGVVKQAEKKTLHGQVVVCCIASLGAGAVMGLEAGVRKTCLIPWYG